MPYNFGQYYIYDTTVDALLDDEGIGDNNISGYFIKMETIKLRNRHIDNIMLINEDLIHSLLHSVKPEVIKTKRIEELKTGNIKWCYVINSHINDKDKKDAHTVLFALDVPKQELHIYDPQIATHPRSYYKFDLEVFKNWLARADLNKVTEIWETNIPQQHNNYCCVFYSLSFLNQLLKGEDIHAVNKKYVTNFKKELLKKLLKSVHNVVITWGESVQLLEDKPPNVVEWYKKLYHDKGKLTYEEQQNKKLINKPENKKAIAPAKEIAKRNEKLQKVINEQSNFDKKQYKENIKKATTQNILRTITEKFVNEPTKITYNDDGSIDFE